MLIYFKRSILLLLGVLGFVPSVISVTIVSRTMHITNMINQAISYGVPIKSFENTIIYILKGGTLEMASFNVLVLISISGLLIAYVSLAYLLGKDFTLNELLNVEYWLHFDATLGFKKRKVKLITYKINKANN